MRKPKRAKRQKDRGTKAQSPVSRVQALRIQARSMARDIENGKKRLRGLAQKYCGVDDIGFCCDEAVLKHILVMLRNIKG